MKRNFTVRYKDIDIVKILELYNSGLSVRSVARITNIPSSSLYYILSKKYGIKLRGKNEIRFKRQKDKIDSIK